MAEPTESDDGALIAAMQRGSHDALAAVLGKYASRVKGYLVNRFRVRLREPEIDEALNVTACNLWRTIQTFNPDESSLLGWFIRIAHNAALDEIRKHQRHAAEALAVEPEFRPAKASDRPDGAQETLTERRLRLMHHIITHELKGKMRAVAMADLVAGGEADRKELARDLGIPVTQVDVTRSQSRKRIRERVLQLEQSETSRAGKS